MFIFCPHQTVRATDHPIEVAARASSLSRSFSIFSLHVDWECRYLASQGQTAERTKVAPFLLNVIVQLVVLPTQPKISCPESRLNKEIILATWLSLLAARTRERTKTELEREIEREKTTTSPMMMKWFLFLAPMEVSPPARQLTPAPSVQRSQACLLPHKTVGVSSSSSSRMAAADENLSSREPILYGKMNCFCWITLSFR